MAAIRTDSGIPTPPTFRTYDDQNTDGRMSAPSPTESALSCSSELVKAPPVAIPRQPTTVNNGPISRPVTIPARPKPGRKPMTEDTDDKRKTQNRLAQRAFRDRRATKIKDLEHAHALKEQQYRDIIAQKDAVIRQQSLKVAQDEAQIAQLQTRINNLESQLSSSTTGPIHPYASVPTPPEDDSAEMETDFTAMFAKPKPPVPSLSHQEDHVMGDSPIGEADHCGFCTRPDNCLCRAEEEIPHTLPPIMESRSDPISSTLENSAVPSFLEAPTRATGPGSCDMCLADPEKARQCQEMARATRFTITSSSTGSKTTTTSTPMTPDGDSRVSCSDFLTTARQKNVQLGPDLYRRMQNVYPYAHRSELGSSHSPAMEIDAQDAAHALAEMSRGVGSKEGVRTSS